MTLKTPPLIDHEFLQANLTRQGVPGDLILTVIESFATNGASEISDLAAAVDRSDLKSVEFLAHKLKGASAALGAACMAEVTGAVEAAAARGDIAEARARSGTVASIFASTVGEFRMMFR
jgi:HPt (histidine-containing phosphotransfer) domain-containing protein